MLNHNLRGTRTSNMAVAVSFKRIFTGMLKRMVATKLRRSILLSSLVVQFKQQQNIDTVIAGKINKALGLNSKTDLLMLPLSYSNIIWGRKISDIDYWSVCEQHCGACNLNARALSDAQQKNLLNLIYQGVPEWLKYDDPNKIKKDIQTMLVSLDSI